MNYAQRRILLFSIFLAGFAGVSWEILWQIKASLAIGVSAQATAFIIAATMGGMSLGAIVAGRLLYRLSHGINPFLLYFILECFIAVHGLFLEEQFRLASIWDANWHQYNLPNASIVQIGLIGLIIIPASMSMGASIPVFGLIAKSSRTTLGELYAINIAGAAIGVLLTAFLVIPITGISLAATILSLLNFLVAILIAFVSPHSLLRNSKHNYDKNFQKISFREYYFAFLSGFTIFILEVSYFRGMRAAFLSTTHSFSIMLATVLVSLAAGASLAKISKNNTKLLPEILLYSGVVIFLVVPLLDRLDIFTLVYVGNIHIGKMLLAISLIAPVFIPLGIIFPFLIENHTNPRSWGSLQAINTIGAVIGALIAAWVLLPFFGVSKTLILTGVLLVLSGVVGSQVKFPMQTYLIIVLTFCVAYFGEANVGKRRIIGMRSSNEYKILGFEEAPDFTVSVIEEGDHRSLYIDGFSTSSVMNLKGYMSWMARLPMLLHNDPKSALVICFGTGETAHALRAENPNTVDVVDISQSVFNLAHLFPSNQGVLSDPRVTPIVMDGRAWLRRTQKIYDVITLEPMPPTFAGVNSLYSREFYQLASSRLNNSGTISQWLPLHLITTEQASAITKTFIETFPNSMMWLYPPYRTPILVGVKSEGKLKNWPGFERSVVERELSSDIIKSSVILDDAGLKAFAKDALIITDDNQFLSYGLSSQKVSFLGGEDSDALRWEKESLQRITSINMDSPASYDLLH